MLGGAGDDVSSGETDSQSQREVAALIQKLLAKATHPSPAKVPVSSHPFELRSSLMLISFICVMSNGAHFTLTLTLSWQWFIHDKMLSKLRA